MPTLGQDRIDVVAPLSLFVCFAGMAFSSWAALILGGPEIKTLVFLFWQLLPWVQPILLSRRLGRNVYSRADSFLFVGVISMAACSAWGCFSVIFGTDKPMLLFFLPLVLVCVWGLFWVMFRVAARRGRGNA